jgi:hypothetical protein
MVTGGENVRRTSERYRASSSETPFEIASKKVDFAQGHADIFCLATRETTWEVGVTKEASIACSIRINVQTKKNIYEAGASHKR